MSSATIAFGSVFKYEGPPEVEVAELTNISGPSLSADTIEVTSHDSTSRYREFLQGIRDGGEITVEGNSVSGNAGQARVYSHYLSDTAGGVQKVVIALNDGSYWLASCIVTNFQPTDAPYDGKIPFSATFKVTGVPTFTLLTSTGLTSPYFAVAGSDSGALSPTPAASGTVYAYAIAAANADETVTVTPTATAGTITVWDGSTSSEIVATGVASSSISLDVGDNLIYIHVQETDKMYKLYTLTITRAAA